MQRDTHTLIDAVDSVSHTSHEYDAVVGRWLLKYAIDLIEIGDPYGHGLGIAKVAKRLGIPVAVNLEDDYGLCPTRDLIDEKGQFCGGQCTPESGSDCSANSWYGPKVRLKRLFVARWRKETFGGYMSQQTFSLRPLRHWSGGIGRSG